MCDAAVAGFMLLLVSRGECWTLHGYPYLLQLVCNLCAGMEDVGSGVFQLAALQASGLIPQLLPHSTGQIMARLHRAARAGSSEALLALSHRFMQVGL